VDHTPRDGTNTATDPRTLLIGGLRASTDPPIARFSFSCQTCPRLNRWTSDF